VLAHLFAALLVAAVPNPPPGGIGGNGSSDEAPPPVVIAGQRAVTTHNGTGGIERHTRIASTSLFATYTTSAVKTCTFKTSQDDFLLADGSRVPKGTQVTSHYLFVEGVAVEFNLPAVAPDAPTGPDATGLFTSKGPLESATREFTIFCDRITNAGLITVPVLDPFLNPRVRDDDLRNSLQLEKPVVYTNPVVDTYGGLVTRYPTWLAIEPDAWRTQVSPTLHYRGSTLMLIAEPRELEFLVVFTPNPDKPSPAFRGTVRCIPGVTAASGGGALPALPVLPEQTEPGTNSNCMWTPPGPGSVTITAQVTYTITFWADGYTAADDDYVWSSAPTTYTTGELNAVNTKP
jgi:hypothetical protein